MEDDIDEETKKRRLTDIINLQQEHSLERNREHVGKVEEILIEGNSKRSDSDWKGRNTQNTMVVFPKKGTQKPGDFVKVKITDCTAATLLGEMIDA
jgi:tRNA-2-methylthio-N6-dimethylallyladenosine synthase